MLKKVVNYSIVGVLLLVLIGGSVYILARPASAQIGQGWAREATAEASQEYGQGRGASQGRETAQGQGQGNARVEALEFGNRAGQGNGSRGLESTNNPEAYFTPSEWETVQGTVIVADNELTLQTAEGEIVVGLGQSWYREQAGFTVNVGDEVIVHGYEEDGEFKAGTVENLTSGTAIMLREQGGRPMWAGRGNLRNQP